MDRSAYPNVLKQLRPLVANVFECFSWLVAILTGCLDLIVYCGRPW